MSSLIDAFNNFIKSLQPQEVGQLNLRSCLGCSFHKVFKNDHFCCQVQPPSKIFNPYDAQLCIYYTPETATTGQITKAERETQSSQLDLIKLINCINLIDRITLIDAITSITNIANIASLDLIDRISLIDNLTNVGTLNLLNTVNLIKSISSIDSITNIGSITSIDRIKKIDDIQWSPSSINAFINGGFEGSDYAGTLFGWNYVNFALSDYGHNSAWSAKCTNLLNPAIGQSFHVPINSNYVTLLSFMVSAALNATFWYLLYYSDGTYTNAQLTKTADGWELFSVVPTANKFIVRFYIYSPSTTDFYVDDFVLNVESTVAQINRTKLKAQTEREDLISLGSVASPNAGGVQVVAASGSLKIKVYDAEYEGLVNGLHCFYFGTTTAITARRFLTRSTLGVNSKTFVQPRIGNAGDALYLYSFPSETNMPYDLGYVQE